MKDPTIVYASIDVNGGEIWRSTDGGKSYTKRASTRPDGQPARFLGDQGWYDNVIWAGDPTNANFVIVGGVDLWRSTDGGNSLVDISTWWDPRSAHADHHCIVADPRFNGTTNRRVFFGNDGGVYKTDGRAHRRQQRAASAHQRMGRARQHLQRDPVLWRRGQPDVRRHHRRRPGQRHALFRSSERHREWTTIFGGDGGWCAADPTDPKVFYGEYVFLNVHRNTDGGATDDVDGDRYISGQFWNVPARRWDWKPIPFTITDAKNRQALFIAPFVLDPNEPNRILGGGVSLWRTNDAKTANTPTRGPSWAAIKPSAGQPISAIAVAKGNSDIVWVGHTDGQIYKTVNGTAGSPVWQRMDHTGPSPLTPRRYCTGITIDPQRSRRSST